MHHQQSIIDNEDMVSIISDVMADLNSEKVNELLDDDVELELLFSLKKQERECEVQVEPINEALLESEFVEGGISDPKQKKKSGNLKGIYRKADYFIDKHFFPELLELDYGVKAEKKPKRPRVKPTQLIKQLYHKIDYKIDEKFFPQLLEMDYGNYPYKHSIPSKSVRDEEIYENFTPLKSNPIVIVTDYTGPSSEREEFGTQKETQRERLKRMISTRREAGKPTLSDTVMEILFGLAKYHNLSFNCDTIIFTRHSL